MRRMLGVALLACLAFVSVGVQAHEMSMAEMQLHELSPGKFIWLWSAANDKRPAGEGLTPIWPEGCHSQSNALRCGEGGLKGILSIQGVGKSYSAVLVNITWLDGQSRLYTLTSSQPQAHLFGSADDRRGVGEIISSYTVLGIEHILTGIDHQLFVIGLLFLVGFHRRLLWAITAFTAAHSLTLAFSSLGWLVLRSPPVEATIALSIVLVAGEALHQQQTLARQYPAAVAFLFGLVHGLGFAGSLKEIGLPEHQFFAALLTFNLGVEFGQLLIISVALALYGLTLFIPRLVLTRTPILYGIGSIAAYWSWQRAMAIFT